MKNKKFKDLNIGETFYMIGEYGKINQYEKISDGYAEEIMTTSTVFLEDDVQIYID
jgi:hypothetical protein